MIMLGSDKKKISDGLIDGIVGGKKAYSTSPSMYPESAKLCAMELIKALENKDPNKVIAAFIALDYECDGISGEEEEEGEEGPKLEIEF
jgi:hypothetical protein